jgi:hypothetical protein
MRPIGNHAEDQPGCQALFASPLQESDALTPHAVADAISNAVRRLGAPPAGCTSRMAQEFGDHPEEARDRMRWVRHLLGQLSAPSGVASASRVPG